MLAVVTSYRTIPENLEEVVRISQEQAVPLVSRIPNGKPSPGPKTQNTRRSQRSRSHYSLLPQDMMALKYTHMYLYLSRSAR